MKINFLRMKSSKCGFRLFVFSSFLEFSLFGFTKFLSFYLLSRLMNNFFMNKITVFF